MKSAGSSHQPVRSENDGARAELERLRVARRRHALVIATLSEAVSNFHRGLKALRPRTSSCMPSAMSCATVRARRR